MSIKRFMLSGGNAALENGSLTADGIVEATEVIEEVTSIDEEIVEITEILDPATDEVEEKLEELEEHNEALADTEQLEEKIDELTALVDDEDQDIEYVTARVDGALEVATEMFTARYGLSFASTKDKLSVARENHTGSVDSRRAQLRASLEDAKEKSGGFKKWISGVIDKILKWFADFYHRHLTGIGNAGKTIEKMLKKVEGDKTEFTGAGEVVDAPKVVANTFGFIDKNVDFDVIRRARKDYSIILNETPKIFKGIAEASGPGEIKYNGPLLNFTEKNPAISGLLFGESFLSASSPAPLFFFIKEKPTDVKVTLPTRKDAIGFLKAALSITDESRKFYDAMAKAGKEFKTDMAKAREEGSGTTKFEAWMIRTLYTSSANATVRMSSDYLKAVASIVSLAMKTKSTPESAPASAAKLEDKSDKK